MNEVTSVLMGYILGTIMGLSAYTAITGFVAGKTDLCMVALAAGVVATITYVLVRRFAK